MNAEIRLAKAEDRSGWEQLRSQLWPDCPPKRHLLEIEQLLANGGAVVVAAAGGELVGFVEISLRVDHVEGTSVSPVPYLEAWYVADAHRGRGIGRALLVFAEHWAAERGFRELASDAEIGNENSIRLHKTAGFREVGRDVHFVKLLASQVAKGRVASVQLPEGYVIEEGLHAVDWLRIHSWLTGSYWSPGVTREQVERAARHSALVLSVFCDQGQVGFLRVISDKTRFAYICDVWVDAAHRRRGLARSMVRYAMAHPEFSTVSWLLATADAHGVYAPLGFSPLKEPQRFMGCRAGANQ